MISFESKNVFTDAPLDKTIDFILKKYIMKRKSKQTFPKGS